MEKLIENIKQNYKELKVTTMKKIKEKTINDIYLIDNKYVVKIYNIDEEKQILASIKTQKRVHDMLGIAPNIILNNEKQIVSKYDNQLYCIQDFVKSEESRIDIIEEVARELFKMHKEFKQFNQDEYKFEKKSKSFDDIKKEILYNFKILDEENVEKEVKNSLKILLSTRLKYLEKYHCEYKPQIYQVIHGDIRLSNIIPKNNKVYFIDFDFVSKGDLLFEIGSAAMLISNYDLRNANRFLQVYNSFSDLEKYDNNLIFTNLLSYYVQSSFPIRLLGKIENKALKEMIDGRINCLEFCNNFLESER